MLGLVQISIFRENVGCTQSFQNTEHTGRPVCTKSSPGMQF